MDDAKYDDLFGQRMEVDGVRKAWHECATNLALDARVRESVLGDTGKHCVDFRRKGSAKLRALILVLITGVV